MTIYSGTVVDGEFGLLSGDSGIDMLVQSGGRLILSSGALAESTTVSGNGSVIASSGAKVVGTVVSSGELHINGEAADTTIGSEGFLYVNGSGTTTNTELYGDMRVSQSATMYNTNIRYDGILKTFDATVTASSTVVFKGGELHAFGGGLFFDTTVSGGSAHIANGTVASNNNIISGALIVNTSGMAIGNTVELGTMYVSATGSAVDTTVNSGGGIYAYGTLSDLTVVSGAELNGFVLQEELYFSSVENGVFEFANVLVSDSKAFINSGCTVSDIYILSNGGVQVLDGGTASAMIISSGGYCSNYDGGIINEITVSSGGSIYVSSQGGLYDLTIHAGGSINGFILSSDNYFATVVNGVLNLSDVELRKYGMVVLSSGSTINNISIIGNGIIDILAGATVTDIDVGWGTIVIEQDSVVDGVYVAMDGEININDGGIATDVTIASGGIINGFVLEKEMYSSSLRFGEIHISGAYTYGEVMLAGGNTAEDISLIESRALLDVVSGGSAAGVQVDSYARLNVYQGGNVSDVTMGFGSYINGFFLFEQTYFESINDGVVHLSSVAAGSNAFVGNGSTVKDFDVGINVSVYNGGVADSGYIMDSATACVYSGGIMNNTTVASGGSLLVYNGADLNNTWIAAGGSLNGFIMEEDSTFSVLGKGKVYISGALVQDSAFVDEGVIVSDIIVSNSILDSSAVLNINYNGEANDVTLLEGGEVLINSGATVNVLANSGGILTISSGGVLNNYIHSGYSDKIVVESGAKINGLSTERFGWLEISGGGEVNDAQINTGIISIYGGVINGFDNDGSIWLYSGAVIKDGIMRSSMNMQQGTSASNINITKGGNVNVYDGAIIQDVVLSGVMTIWEGGSGAQIILKDNAFLSVSNDAYISNLIVESGGFAHVCQGEDILIKDGGMLSVGGTEEGIKDITLAGGSMELFAMNPLPIRCDSITFELSGEMPNAMINADISKVTCSQYYLSVAEGNSSQEYILCSNSNGFSQSITVINSSGDELGALKVGETLSTNYGEYSLTEADGKLLLSYNATVINEAVSGLTATIKSAEELAAGDSLTLTSVNYTVSDSQIGVFSATNGVLNGGAMNVTGNVKVTVTSTSGDVIGAIYGGGLGLNQSIGEDVLLTLEGGTYGYIYTGGYSAVSGNIKTVIGDVTVNKNIYGGTAYTNPDSVMNNVGGSTTVEVSSGVILNQVYAGNYVNCDNFGGEVKSTVSGGSYLNISGGTFTGPVVMAGGVGVATGSGSSYVISEVNGGTHVNVTGGEIAYLYGGGRGGASTVNADYGASVVNDGSHITISGGDIKVVYGGGYCDAGYSYVNGGASITLTAGTIGTVFGGGSGTGGAARNSIVDNVNITVDATGDLSIADIYGGGNGRAQVSGDVTITLHGSNGHNLSINGLISGGGRNGVSGVGGDRTLQIEDYQGSLDATIVNFNTIRINEYTEVALSKVQDFSTVDTFIFDAPMQAYDATAGMLLSGDTVWGGSKLLKLNVDSGVYDAEIVLLSNLGNDISSFADANYEFNVLGTLEDGYSSGVMSGIDLESGLGSAWYNEIDEAYYRLEIGEFDTLAGLDLRLKVIDAYSDEGLQLKAQLA